MKALIAADAFIAIPTFLWVFIFRGVAGQYAELPAYGYSGTWDFWVYFPLAMTSGLLLSIVLFNFVMKKAKALVLIAIMALLPVLPYSMAVSGGV